MNARLLILAVCLLCAVQWQTGHAQQTAAPLGVPAPPEPHPVAPAAGPAAPAAAGPVVYNVEVLVFRTNTSLGSPENWSAELARSPGVPLAADGESGAAAADAPTSAGHLIRMLDASELQLSDLESRIRASGTYVPVAHAGWAQTASPWGTRTSLSLKQLGVDAPGLAGTVTLERGQYLHLGFAMSLMVANPPQGLAAAPQTTFILNDNHRVKFYERNYFDSPAFGVIALVAPAQGARRAGR